MPDGATFAEAQVQARIGPNSILQLAGPLEAQFDASALPRLLSLAHVDMPSGNEMIPEEDAVRVHRLLWQHFPEQGPHISSAAGRGTASYIRANRIPAAARLALRCLPRRKAENMLLRAIERHAWTFCGSGHFEAERRGLELHFILHNNPLADIHQSPGHPCHWHSAVFAELFTLLLGARYSCTEASCLGCGGSVCRFVVGRQAGQPAPDAARH